MKNNLIVPSVEQISVETVAADALVLPVFSGKDFPEITRQVDKKLKGKLSGHAKRFRFEGDNGQVMSVDLDGWKTPKILLVGLGLKKELDRVTMRDAYALCAQGAANVKMEDVVLLQAEGKDLFFDAAVEGFLLGMYRFNKYKKKPERPQTIKNVTLGVLSAGQVSKCKAMLDRILVSVAATYTARDLVNEPANVVNPTFMEKLAYQTAKEGGLTFKVFNEAELRKKGMNLIVAVGMGSKERPRLVHMEYKPKGKAKRTIALIGKGVCFDSGGLSLKPQDNMYGMKGDMAGAAAVLCTMGAIAKLKPEIHVHGVFPLVENIPSHESVKPGDVFVGYSGKSVEIENTDAEGRLILADALAYVNELKVDEAIDCATLTGAIVVALGDSIAGLMSPNDALAKKILSAAERAGESIWRMPLEKSYLKLLKSDVADLKNVAGRGGGAITAALFLEEFAPDCPWAHIDIAGPSDINHEIPICPKGGTGFLVRTFLEYITAN
jgi:leucyl aminopeptidase